VEERLVTLNSVEDISCPNEAVQIWGMGFGRATRQFIFL